MNLASNRSRQRMRRLFGPRCRSWSGWGRPASLFVVVVVVSVVVVVPVVVPVVVVVVAVLRGHGHARVERSSRRVVVALRLPRAVARAAARQLHGLHAMTNGLEERSRLSEAQHEAVAVAAQEAVTVAELSLTDAFLADWLALSTQVPKEVFFAALALDDDRHATGAAAAPAPAEKEEEEEEDNDAAAAAASVAALERQHTMKVEVKQRLGRMRDMTETLELFPSGGRPLKNRFMQAVQQLVHDKAASGGGKNAESRLGGFRSRSSSPSAEQPTPPLAGSNTNDASSSAGAGAGASSSFATPVERLSAVIDAIASACSVQFAILARTFPSAKVQASMQDLVGRLVHDDALGFEKSVSDHLASGDVRAARRSLGQASRRGGPTAGSSSRALGGAAKRLPGARNGLPRRPQQRIALRPSTRGAEALARRRGGVERTPRPT